MNNTGHPRAIQTCLAQVLFELSDEIESLGPALCADPQVAKGHFERMQGLGVVSQSASMQQAGGEATSYCEISKARNIAKSPAL